MWMDVDIAKKLWTRMWMDDSLEILFMDGCGCLWKSLWMFMDVRT